MAVERHELYKGGLSTAAETENNMSAEAERISGHLSIAEGEFAEGNISREDFIGKLLIIDDDALDANEDDDITDEEYCSLQDELRAVMEKFGITYEESGLVV